MIAESPSKTGAKNKTNRKNGGKGKKKSPSHKNDVAQSLEANGPMEKPSKVTAE